METLVTLETHRPGKQPSLLKKVYITEKVTQKEDLPPEIIEALPGGVLIFSFENENPTMQKIMKELLGKKRQDEVKLGGNVTAIIKDIVSYKLVEPEEQVSTGSPPAAIIT